MSMNHDILSDKEYWIMSLSKNEYCVETINMYLVEINNEHGMLHIYMV